MVEIFEDEGGEWRYRIRGKNGEPMVTSEGYGSSTDARRGYIDLRALMQHRTPLQVKVIRKKKP